MKKQYYLAFGVWVIILSSLCPHTMTAQHLALSTSEQQAVSTDQQSGRSLSVVLKELEKTYHVSFYYQVEDLENKFVSKEIQVTEQEDLEKKLAELLQEYALDFKKVQKDYYYVFKREPIELPEKINKNSTSGSINKDQQDKQALASLHHFIPDQHLIVPQQTISGKVTDTERNEPLPGVNVLAKGTLAGTVTDIEGNYQITVEDSVSTLVFSSIGFKTTEIEIGNRNTINVSLSADVQALDEVVVTALGIKREAKTLGYATATVAPEEITVNRTSNFMNALQGKMAGVNISQLGSGPAGTSKIRIRGQSSFGGNNSPLIVVNGVPIDNTNFGARGESSERGSNRTSDSGDGLSSINPDDIENMTVLKGAAASALYGSRAKDGVIMITTRTRGDGQGIGIEFNTNFTHGTPLDFTDYQYEYGQGENGERPTTPNPLSGQWSFGEKFQPGMTQILFDGVEVPYEPQRNQITDYYQTANTFTNTITLSSGGEFGGFSLSLSNLDDQAILPGSRYNRKTVNLGFTQTVAKKLTVSGNINYSHEYRKNPPNIAEQDYSPVVLYSMANSMPLELLKQYATDENGDEYPWSRFTNRTNPYFALTRFDNIDKDRIFGNLTARYDFTDWLYLQGRIGQDFYSREQDYNLPTGSQRQPPAPPGFVNGEYVQDARRFRELNTDILLGVNRTFGPVGINLNLGGNQMYRKLTRNNVLVNDFYTRGLYTLGNGRQRDAIYDISERQVNSVYAAAEVSFKEFLFLNGTVRNDWFSTLSPENRSILYPSVTGSFVFSQAFGATLPEWISFGKIRAAYAEVGSDTDVAPYSNSLYFNINPQQFADPNGTLQPMASISGSTVPNPNLRPMRVTEKEVGLELQLFEGFLGFDLTYYDKLSSDQILQAQTSDGSGYLTQLINVGESRNRGVEMLVTLAPVRRANFSWNASFNAAYNTSEVLDLGEDVSDDMITVGVADFHGELRQVVGKPIAQLFGYGYLRDDQGRIIHDAGNGRPLRTPEQISFGSAIPRWIGGISNNFNYKGLTMSFLIDFKLGHKMISGTHTNAYRHGLDKATLVGRDQGYVIGEGVNQNGEANTTQSGVQAYYETIRSLRLSEQSVFNAGLWQLRQITLGYDFTRHLTNTVPFIKGLRLSAVANNVAVIKKWVPHIHPDQFGFPSDNLVGLEATGLPITRNIGFNLNIKF
ncbi:SusC/RagA family TonB-linked outer membrane protein [Catalinimonas niigatensis]|uniref:SusC/RagA family TonB-linked outer membrane protein n=1 Tax=Catalinimonas niigatensis TaxID=1397264 RepID=UPI0026664533|nr:SusC/RagA family TonB-linked outer membrane protein [Catalinimonas niigatensis]WPP51476.1 SusC/RagA family TonB-linked outer membrane protein [Catalinimonas niigatensis]